MKRFSMKNVGKATMALVASMAIGAGSGVANASNAFGTGTHKVTGHVVEKIYIPAMYQGSGSADDNKVTFMPNKTAHGSTEAIKFDPLSGAKKYIDSQGREHYVQNHRVESKDGYFIVKSDVVKSAEEQYLVYVDTAEGKTVRCHVSKKVYDSIIVGERTTLTL